MSRFHNRVVGVFGCLHIVGLDLSTKCLGHFCRRKPKLAKS